MYNKTAFILLLFFIKGSILFAQDVLTMDQAVEIMLKNNFSISIARNNTDIAKNNNTIGNAGELPDLTFLSTATSASNNTKLRFSSGENIDKDNATATNINASVVLNWTIFDGLNMFATKSKLTELEAQGMINLKIRIENAIAEAINTYYSIVKQQQLVKALNEDILVSEERAKIADRKYANGSGSKLDLLQAKVDLNAQRSALIKQKTALEESKVKLNQLLSRSLEMKFGVADTVIISYRPSFDQLKTTVYQRNNELLFSEKSLRICELGLKQIKAQHYPKISLLGSYVFSRADNQAGLILENQSLGFNYGIAATMPLFKGFVLKNQVQNARIGMMNSRLEFDQAKLFVEASLVSGFREFENNLEVLKLEEENIQYARESLSIALERFRVGLSNSVEFRDAQRSFEEAMSRLASARFNAKVSETNLMKLNGDLVK